MAKGWILFIVLSLIVCSGCEPAAAEVTSIGDIITQPSYYEGSTVTVNGEYRGWEAGYGLSPVTRSDWVIKDETGGIYVTGKSPRLDPLKDKGSKIQVTGVVHVKDSQAYIEVKTIK